MQQKNALRVLMFDLDLSSHSFSQANPVRPKPLFIFEVEGDDGVSVLLVVLEWTCPDWFEPTTRKLSLNYPCWLNLSVQPNYIEDFEPWSRTTLRKVAIRELVKD